MQREAAEFSAINYNFFVRRKLLELSVAFLLPSAVDAAST